MATYLIADSGSTKTDWCLVKKGSRPTYFHTQGINPHIQSAESVAGMLMAEIPWGKKHIPDEIHFYGAGAAHPDKQKLLSQILRKHFGSKKAVVQSDLAGAAKALCGNEKGIVCILGTGSSSCYYDGKKVKEQKPSLGYLAGDEGSGNHIGKRVLQYYAYGTFDTEMRTGFEMRYGKDVNEIVKQLYQAEFPNRYLAQFATMLVDLRGHYMAENIIEDCINDFLHNNVLKYRQAWKFPLYFTGSVAWYFRDVIENLCNQYELEIGRIEQNPINGLVRYYKTMEA